MKTKLPPTLAKYILSACLAGSANLALAEETPTGALEVLTPQEAAGLLRVDSAELLRMAAANEIPARKFGKDWRFNRTAVMAWLAGKDPVGATLLAQTSNSPIPPIVTTGPNPAQLLAKVDMTKTVARGMGEQQSATSNTPETIGEKPQTKTAEEVFLRDQAVLLKPRQLTLELGLLYARNDSRQLVSQIDPFFGSIERDATAKSDAYTGSFSLRYGLMDNLQIFSSVPVSHQSQSLSFGSQELSQQSSTRWGSITSGLRYAALAEGSGYPGVIFSLDGTFPTDNRAYGLGGSMALTKSYDPAVLFFNVGYRHFFNGASYDVSRLSSANQFNATAGIAYALNDTLTLSTSLSGVFHAKTNLQDNLILPSREQYSLQFGLTSYLAKGLFIEPFVNFGLNGNSSDVMIGTNLPYTFDL